MTVNQINYQNLVEKMRNNLAIETETNRHNQAIEDYNRGVLSEEAFKNKEVQRHNLIMEDLQKRANQIDAYRAELTKLYNEAQVNISNRRAAEEERSNRANELITAQRNAWQHEVDVGEAATRRYVAEQNVLLETNRQSETERHNLITEEETWRHNQTTEAETRRYNTWSLINSSVSSAGAMVNALAHGAQIMGIFG